jgi:proline iminopeptidase
MSSPAQEVSGYTHEEAFNSGYLSAGSIHKIWYAEHGLPNGRPVLFLHGGPGGGTSLANTSFFDPSVYRVVLMDQRGGGKSTPAAEIRENTTHDLVKDIEQLRQHLGIEHWTMVFGGSWGSTLALAYAQAFPQATSALVLRGIFAVRKSELANAFAPYGVTNQLFPETWEEFVDHLRSNAAKSAEDLDLTNPHTVLSEYYRLLCHEEAAVRNAAARAWNKLEVYASTVILSDELVNKLNTDEVWNIQHARIECHYFLHGAWLEDGALLDPKRLELINGIRCTSQTLFFFTIYVSCPQVYLTHRC